MKITIETIQEDLKKINWKCLSTEYKNLDSELVFECEEGHKVYSTYRKIRNKAFCPICQQNKYKNPEPLIKREEGFCVIGLDQATHTSGWSVFINNELKTYGTFKTKLEETNERINEVKHWLINMVHNWRPDLVGLEDIQLQKFGGKTARDSDNVIGVQTFKILAHLQGVLIDALIELGVEYRLAPPATWRSYCGTKGKTKVDKKRSVQLKVKEWYDVSVENDEADAIGVGKYITDNFKDRVEIENWE